MKNPGELKGDKNVCAECGREQAVDERGWQEHLTTDEDEPAEAIVYCPDCAVREFGEPENAGPL